MDWVLALFNFFEDLYGFFAVSLGGFINFKNLAKIGGFGEFELRKCYFVFESFVGSGAFV